MTFTVELLPDLPVLLIKWDEDFSVKDHIKDMDAQAYAALDSASEPVYFVADIRDADGNWTIEDIVGASNLATQGKQPTFKHPNVKRIVFVSNSRLVKMTAKGLNNVSFGNIVVDVFETTEDALQHIREQIAV